MSINYDRLFKRLVNACERLGWSVVLDDIDSEACFLEKKITISKSKAPSIRFHMLMHELGHVLIEELPTSIDVKRPNSGMHKTTTSIHKTLVLSDECAAWDRGYYHATSVLRLKFDKRLFEMSRAKYIKTYASWLLRTKKQILDNA